jgi:methyltransferase (TIGR00027 family)
MKAERPSETALLIARAMVFLAHDPRVSALVPPEAAEEYRWFLESADPRTARLAARAGANRLLRSLAYFWEGFAIPGIMLHYAVRKLFLEDAARAALASFGPGTGQVVVLGAGLDTLALRLHRERPDVRFFECDHPATQRLKRQAVEAHRPLGANLHLVELDLARRTLEETLPAAPGYRPEAATLLIAEGLTMYLTADAMDGIFAFLRGHTGPGSRFVFTFMEPQEDGRIDFPGASPLVRPWLHQVGEPFTWGLRRAELPGWLAARGCSLAELAGADTLRERYLAPAGLGGARLAVGEWLAVVNRVVDRGAVLDSLRIQRPAE